MKLADVAAMPDMAPKQVEDDQPVREPGVFQLCSSLHPAMYHYCFNAARTRVEQCPSKAAAWSSLCTEMGKWVWGGSETLSIT